MGLVIIGNIAADFLTPEILPGRRPLEQVAVVAMPEAAIHQNDRPVARKDEIRFPRQVLCMQTVAQPKSVQRLADQQLRLCMPVFDCGHIPAAGMCVVNVRHTSGGFALPGRVNQSLDMGLHDPGNRFEHGNSYRVAELLIGLGV